MGVLSGMTGFARTDGSQGSARWSWEVRSVNGKGLEARLRLPPGFDRLDIKSRELAKNHFARGNLQLSLNLRQEASERALSVDIAHAHALLDAARPIGDRDDVVPARLDGVLRLEGVLKTGVEEEDADALVALDKAILESLGEALAGLKSARAEEGAALLPVLNAHIDDIEQLTGQAAACASARSKGIKDRIAAKFAELLPEGLDEERLAQEAAAMSIKMDVREEIDRLEAHVIAARELLQAGSPVGRKLDFLSQEFNREANTLCSKAADSSLTAIGLALKNTIDQFREQIQNVE
ncbi:MAG: YicC family protein [Alphaproteobacteria bacterium]|nr:YicC family protein [Alphaproteobacteria bacterium]